MEGIRARWQFNVSGSKFKVKVQGSRSDGGHRGCALAEAVTGCV